MGFITDIRAADNDVTGTEAARAVLGYATGPGDARMLLSMLGLTGVHWGWDTARCAVVALRRGRDGGVLNSNVLRGALPEREAWRVPAVLKAIVATGLATPTGEFVPAAQKAAKGRPVRCYQLTPAGEQLAAELVPVSCEPYLVTLSNEQHPPRVA